jgi:hypothetical protein
MGNSFTELLLSTLRESYEAMMQYLPGLLVTFVIILVGWAVARISSVIARRLLIVAKFDRLCADAGLGQVLARADIRSSPSALAGRSVFWLVFVVSFMFGISALGLEVINQLIAEFFLYLPRIFAALLILLLAFLIGNFLSRAVLLAAVNTSFPSPRIASGVVKYLIAILAFAMALEQLHIASNIVTAAFAIAFGSVMLGLAIAFGLGGRDIARQVLERRFLKSGEDEPDEFSHI